MDIRKCEKGTVYILLYALFAYIFWRVPYCHDEWAWGLPEKIDLMKKGFDGYNGRYLGNPLAILITRSMLAKTFLLSAIMLILFVLLQRILGLYQKENETKNRLIRWVLVMLLLAVPRTIFAQTYGWVAAFVNFVPPVVLFFVVYLEMEKAILYGKGEIQRGVCLLLIPVAIASQLFSEHNTVFHILYLLIVIGYGYFLYHKISRSYLTILISYGIGAFLMFSNSAYRNAANDTDGYKKIGFSLRSMIGGYVDNMSDHLFLNNWILNGILAAVLIILIIHKVKNRVLASELIFVLSGYAFYGIWHKVYPEFVFSGTEFYDDCMRAFLGIVFYLHVLIAIVLTTEGKERVRISMMYVFAVLVAGPLLAANPIGARCFYVSYLYQMMTVLMLLQVMLPEEKDYWYAIVVAGAACILIAFVYARIFMILGNFDQERARLIKEAKEENAKELALPYLPYSEYCWTTEPPNITWAKRFKKFYGLNKDVTITFYEP